MLDSIQRIHIVGGPGSGKTTLAGALALQVGTSAHDLDDVALSEGAMRDFRPKRSLSIRRDEVGRLSHGALWITEGSYLWWTEALFERADVIVWLDTPWPIAARRIVRRHVRNYFSDIVRAPNVQTRLRAIRYPHIRNLIGFLRWSAHYYGAQSRTMTRDIDPDDMRALTRDATRRYLDQFGPKVIRIVKAERGIAIAELARGNRQPNGGFQFEPKTPSQGQAAN